MTDDRLRQLAEAHGVAHGYWGYDGSWQETPEATLRAVLEAMGVTPDEHGADDGDPRWPPVVVTRPGVAAPWAPPSGSEVRLEDGSTLALEAALPTELPLGYHEVVGEGGRTRLVVAPHAAYLPPRLAEGGRAWGFALQLYALRSRASWGLGDLGDLAGLVTAESTAGFALINPLHGVRPTLPQARSPYSPSTRLFRNPLYLRVDAVDEVHGLHGDARARFDVLAEQGRSLTARDRIDRDAVFAVKDEALRLLHGALSDARRAELAAWRAATPDVDAYAAFCALVQDVGTDWREWPAELRHPGSPAVSAFAARHAGAVEYHAYVQWLLSRQLADVPRGELGVVNDLAIGVAPDGFDAWLWQDDIAAGMEIGAPPDPLGPLGQNWGFPAIVPARWRAKAYEPFVRIIRANLEHVGGLRLDHVMGLFRLFWIPQGRPTAEGVYVHQPFEDLLAVLCLESHRAQALIVGEDLGTLDDRVRERLAETNVLSYRLAWFERGAHGPRRPYEYPRGALAAVTTHDLPTVAGFFGDTDLEEQRRAGVIPDEKEQEIRAEHHGRKAELLGLLEQEGLIDAGERDPEALAVALYRLLARAPSMLVAASLDDALGAVLRPNMPGTVDEYPNWSLPLPVLLEDLPGDARLRRLVDALAEVR